MTTILPRDFYSRCTIEVARDLLGRVLVREFPDGRQIRACIVETEAYLGLEDPAAHSFRGPTPRCEVMFGDPGYSYIYFVYGMYHCLNVVTRPKGIGEAVLFRALAAFQGTDELMNGPGKICRTLSLSRQENALDLCRKERLWIEAGEKDAAFSIAEGPRVGIAPHNEACHWPLRFGVAGHPSLSPAKFPP